MAVSTLSGTLGPTSFLPVPASPSRCPGSMHALLVIDEAPTRDALERALESRGWRVDHASTVDGAIKTAHELGPRVVVVEQESVSETARACRMLRESEWLSRAYMLVLVDRGDADAVLRCVEVGADDVVTLPIDDDDLQMRFAVMEARLGFPGGGPGLADTIGAARRFRIPRPFLEGLFEVAPEGVAILDLESRVVRINEEFTRVFGYSLEEAVGQPINDLIAPEERRGECVELDWGVQHGERVMIETTRRHRSGRRIDVSVLATSIDAQGGPVGAFAIYRDITEKKAGEAAVRESEARYRALFDQSPVGVFLCDRDLRITHCNEQLSRIIASPYDQIVGAELLTLRSSRLLPGIRAALEGQPAFYEGPYRALSGRLIHVSVRYAPLRDEAGEVIGGIGVLEDISDRVQAERRLRAQTAEMERVNAALHERTLELEAAMQARHRLYSAMNHELRTPISAIMLYQELLMAGTLGELHEEQQRALEHSHTATRHLLDLVRDILDLSKIEAGKVSIQPSEVCIRSLLDELSATVSPLTEQYGSHLRLEVAEDVGTVFTDPQRVRQILMNFISNAAKYGRRNPIDVRCARCEGDEIRLEVVDRGVGIAEKDLANIFEDFVQLGAEGAEGTGLGLAICKRLATLLDGRLEVESRLGEGSIFRLVLPLEPLTVSHPVSAAS